MPHALLQLLLIQARAAVRRAGRGLRTVRGALLAAVGGAVFMAWFVPAAFLAGSAPLFEQRLVLEFAPVVLLALTLASMITAGDRAIFFTPAEVNFLFVAPFTRRQLLAYKLSKTAAGALAMAVALALSTRRFSPFWPAAFIGGLLALLFVSLCTVAVALLRRSVEVRAQSPLRQIAAYAALVVLAGGTAAIAARGPHLLESAADVLRSPAAGVALAPLQPFARAYAADNLGDLAIWAAAALLIDAALLAAVMRLDTNYLEAAAAASERAYEQAQRLRRGDWMPGAKLAAAKRRVPPFPYAGGAGPVVRRQLTSLLRKSPKLLFVVLLAATAFIPLLLLGRRLPNTQGALIPTAGWLTVLLVGSLRFDFRGDLDQLPWLKSLPLRPLPLALGQLAVPAAAMTLFHVAGFAAIAAVIAPLRGPALAAIVLAAPFDLLLVAVENLAFLLFPHRQGMPTELGDLGRHIIMFVLKGLAIGIAGGAAAAAGGVVYLVTRSAPAAVAMAALVVAAEALLLVPLVALAYTRFDAGSDLPP